MTIIFFTRLGMKVKGYNFNLLSEIVNEYQKIGGDFIIKASTPTSEIIIYIGENSLCGYAVVCIILKNINNGISHPAGVATIDPTGYHMHTFINNDESYDYVKHIEIGNDVGLILVLDRLRLAFMNYIING